MPALASPLGATELILAAILLGQLPSGELQEVRIRSGPYAFPRSVISVESNLVSSAVTVRDRRGVPVTGLTANDFEILDDGKPQAIKFFSMQDLSRALPAPPQIEPGAPLQTPRLAAPPPRSLALFFDDTHAALFDYRKSVLAAEKVVNEAEPLDRIALFTGSGSIFVDFTNPEVSSAPRRARFSWAYRQSSIT